MAVEVTDDELKTAAQVGWKVGKNWRSVEVEDLQSHLYLWLVEHPTQIERWRTEEFGKGKLIVALKREAMKYCAKETSIRTGQPLTRDNFYNEDMLTRALPFLFENWPETTVRQNPQNGRALDRPFEFSNALAIMADLSGAFGRLEHKDQQIIEWRFRDRLTLEDIGKRRHITKEGARQTVQRVIRRISDDLSGDERQ